MYDNIAEAAAILDGHDVGSGYFSLSIYPPSVPVNLELIQNGVQQSLLQAGGSLQALLLRPLLRRRGRTRQQRPVHPPHHPELPQSGGLQARRGPAVRGGPHGRPVHCRHRPEPRRLLTRASRSRTTSRAKQGKRTFDTQVYDQPGLLQGFGHPQPEAALKSSAPTSRNGPSIPALADNLLMQVASVLRDPVTTTDELIPSGETSSYRSNPMKLAEFALSRRDPDYVPRALDTQASGGPPGRPVSLPAQAPGSPGEAWDRDRWPPPRSRSAR